MRLLIKAVWLVITYFYQRSTNKPPKICRCLKNVNKLKSYFSGNPKRHIAALKSQNATECVGEPSLENSLDLALQTLK